MAFRVIIFYPSTGTSLYSRIVVVFQRTDFISDTLINCVNRAGLYEERAGLPIEGVK